VNWEVPVAWDNCDIPADPDQIELDTSLIISQLIGVHNGDTYDDIQSGQVIPVGTYLIGYVVVDTDGNSDTCSFNLVVWDTQDPILMAGIPEDVTLSCEIPLDTFVMMPHHVMDNCVEDPTIENTLVSTRVMDPEMCGYYEYQDTFFYTVTDDVQTLPDGSPKVNQMIWKWVVTWIDTTAPQIIPPPDTIIESCSFKEIIDTSTMIIDTTFMSIPIEDRMNGLPEVHDNCAPDSLFVLDKPFLDFRDSIEYLCKGDKAAIVHRFWIAEDPCGNKDSVIQKITILDPNPPVLIAEDTVTLSLNPDGHLTLTKDDVVKDLFDACFGDGSDIDVITHPSYFNCGDIGQHVVLITATDPCNNKTAYEEVVVNIIDIFAPQIKVLVPPDPGSSPTNPLAVTIDPFNCDSNLNDIVDILASQDCDVVISTDPDIDDINATTTEIVVTATDASGNSSSTTIYVDVTLSSPIEFGSTLACNDVVNVSLSGECWLELEPDMILEGDPDICTDLLCIEVQDANGQDHLNFFDESDIDQVFTVKVVDCNGSSNSCWAEVRLEEKQLPIIEWPIDTNVLCVESVVPILDDKLWFSTDEKVLASLKSAYSFKVGRPIVLNCEPVIEFDYEDIIVEYDQCSSPRATIERRWVVSDDEGNILRDTQYIDILPFSNDHVQFPKDITIEDPVDCSLVTESIDDIENGVLDPTSSLHPDSTGLPSIFGIDLFANNGLCLFSMGYEDEVLEICDGSFEVLRTWSIRDVCSPFAEVTNPIRKTQVITVYDIDGPEILDKEFNIVRSINPWECSFSGHLPLPDSLDILCGSLKFDGYITGQGAGYLNIEGSYIGGDLQVTAVGVEEGEHWVTYVYIDGCSNVEIFKYKLTVYDGVEPVAVCQDNLIASITGVSDGDGIAKVYAKDIDAGSHDAGCGQVNTCVVLMVDWEAGVLDTLIGGRLAFPAINTCFSDGILIDTTFDKTGNIEMIDSISYVLCKDNVKFCCSDIGTQTVVLHAIDDHGQYNICMADVTVGDKLNASLVCAPHTIDCSDDKSINVLEPIGALDLCDNNTSLEYIDASEFLDGCGEGQIFRTWYIDFDEDGEWDEEEASCNQVITVINDSSFDPYSIKWPKHFTGEVFEGINLECEEDDDGEKNVVSLDVTVSMGDVFTCSATDPGISPVWCNTSCGLVGLSSEVDTVVASDACLKVIIRWSVIDWCYWEANGSTAEDTNDGSGDQFIAVEDWAQGECAGCDENTAPDPVYFRYTTVDEDGYYTYDQVIKVVDDTAPSIETSDVVVNTTGGASSKDDATPCTGEGIISATASDLCGNEAISGELLSWVVSYDNGTETSVTTGNGNEFSMATEAGNPGEEHIVTFVVSDGCGNSTSAESTVTFGDEKAPVPLCIAGVGTAFMESTGTVAVWAKDFDLGSFDNCSDISYSIVISGETPIGYGEEGFEDQASITFDCDDLSSLYALDLWVWDESGNGDFCEVQILIGGNCDFESGSGAMIAGQVHTETGDMIEDVEMTVYNEELGEYPRRMVTDATGEYAFSNNPVGFDYTVQLDSPYKVIAADANNDKSITAIDIVILRKAILGITQDFGGNSSWRFVDAEQPFVDVLNPWPFTQSLSFIPLDTDQVSEDLIGVKIGDVTSSAIANSAVAAKLRTNKGLTFNTKEAEFIKGQEVKVPVMANQLINLSGFQFTMGHNGLTYKSVEEGAISLGADHIGIHDSSITVSWASPNPAIFDQVLFTLVFEADVDGRLSNVLDMNSSITNAEVYEGEAAEESILSLVIDEDASDRHILYQNDPNPFVDMTNISFYLASDEAMEFSIYNATGKLVYKLNENYLKGTHSIELNASILEEKGMYFYSMKTEKQTETKKMVLLN